MFEELVGNMAVKAVLKNLVISPPSTLLFSGPKGLLKLEFAKSFAREIVGTSSVDIQIFSVEEKSKLHSIEKTRHYLKEVMQVPFESKHRVFIIDDAHAMLPSSSQALLKTLEEPLLTSTTILVTDKPEMLLETIVSRSLHLRFQPLQEEAVVEYLVKTHNLTKSDAKREALFLEGSMGPLISSNDVFDDVFDMMASALTGDYSAMYQLIDRLEKEPPSLIFKIMGYVIRDIKRMQYGSEELFYQERLADLQGLKECEVPSMETLAASYATLEYGMRLKTVLEQVLLRDKSQKSCVTL